MFVFRWFYFSLYLVVSSLNSKGSAFKDALLLTDSRIKLCVFVCLNLLLFLSGIGARVSG